ncbi:MAG: hypothetical protein HWN68_08340 [Desulfobacterales bacterium]|nr:hypothetical protein [Desulfobacterales bacterium]
MKRGNPYKKKLHEDGRFYGKYKVKPNSQIPVEDLERALNGEQLSSGHQPKFVKLVRDKSYVVFTFYVGSRKLEPTKVLKEDMVVTDTHIHVQIPAFKHGERGGPLKIRRSNVGVEWIVKQWKKTKKRKPVWPLSPSTAYRIIMRALGRCPHWLRHNWITTKQQTLLGTPSDVDRKIQSWTGIKRRQTLDNYRMKMQKDIDEIAELEV